MLCRVPTVPGTGPQAAHRLVSPVHLKLSTIIVATVVSTQRIVQQHSSTDLAFECSLLLFSWRVRLGLAERNLQPKRSQALEIRRIVPVAAGSSDALYAFMASR